MFPLFIPSNISPSQYITSIPSQGLYGSQMLGDLIVGGVLSLSVLRDIPDENNFSLSYRYAEFVGQTLKAITDLNGET